MTRSSTPSTEYSGLTKAQTIKRCARILFGAYRKDQFADPESFLIQAGAVLERYEEIVVRYVTDVRNHDCLQRTHNWPPTIKEISDACDDQADRVARVRAAQHSPKMIRREYRPPERFPGCRARLFVGQDVPQYGEIVQLADSGELDELDWRFGELNGRTGIWIATSIWESRYRLMHSKNWKSMTDDELRAHYSRREAEAAGTAPAAPIEGEAAL